MDRPARRASLLDTELEHLPGDLRWREWMARVEAVLFAAPEPVGRDVLARLVGRACSLDLLIEDIAHQLVDRPYEIVAVAGGWQFRTHPRYAEAIQAAFAGNTTQDTHLTETELVVLAAIAYHQPITRGALSDILGREVSRDTIGRLRGLGCIAAGPRSPQPGAPYTYVTTKTFLEHFGLETLQDLPDLEALEDAGLVDREKLAAGNMPIAQDEHDIGEDDGDFDLQASR